MKTLFESIRAAAIIALCIFGLFTMLSCFQPTPPTSSGID